MPRRKSPGIRILLVEPEPSQRRSMAELLRERFEVTTTESAAEGRRACREYRPHVVITEVNLPDAYGPAFLAEVRETLPEAILIATYVYGDRTQELDAVLRGTVQLALAKPLDVGNLRRSIRALLSAGRRSRREDRSQSTRREEDR